MAANTVIMTVFLWQMPALLAALTLFEAAGLPIHPEPTPAWWAQRPLWLLVPGVLLAALVAVFAPAETHHSERDTAGSTDSAAVRPPRRDHLGGLAQEHLQVA